MQAEPPFAILRTSRPFRLSDAGYAVPKVARENGVTFERDKGVQYIVGLYLERNTSYDGAHHGASGGRHESRRVTMTYGLMNHYSMKTSIQLGTIYRMLADSEADPAQYRSCMVSTRGDGQCRESNCRASTASTASTASDTPSKFVNPHAPERGVSPHRGGDQPITPKDVKLAVCPNLCTKYNYECNDVKIMQRALNLVQSEGGTEVAFYSHAATQFERVLVGAQGARGARF